MLFMISFSLRPESRNDAQDRFKKTGGTPGPNVKMLGRWHKVAGNQGFVLAESTDTVAIGKWMQEWTDLLLFDIALVVNDEDVMKVLGA